MAFDVAFVRLAVRRRGALGRWGIFPLLFSAFLFVYVGVAIPARLGAGFEGLPWLGAFEAVLWSALGALVLVYAARRTTRGTQATTGVR